jgi:hypothetical protein
MNRTLRLILLLLITAPFNVVFGQANFMEGRIITLQNDTLFGLIKDGFTPRDSRVCIFKESKNATPVKYYPNDLQSYQIQGGKYYVAKDVTVKGENKRVFTLVLLEGDLNLYHQRDDREISYFIEKDPGELIALVNRDREFELKSNWGYYGFTSYSDWKIPEYRDTLYDLFSDSRVVQSQVYSVKYTPKSFLKITKAYVRETCQGSNCISYENQMRSTRERFGFFTGVFLSKINFEDSPDSYMKTTVPIGVFYSIPLSFLHDRLSFQNEVIYRWMEYDELYNIPNETIYSKLKWDVVGVPLSIQYRYSVKKVSPVIGFGKEFGFVVNSDIVAITEGKFPEDEPIITSNEFIYKNQKGGWFLDLGCDFELNSNISLFSNIRIQHYRNKVITDQYENNFTFKVAEGTALDTYSAALHVGVRF